MDGATHGSKVSHASDQTSVIGLPVDCVNHSATTTQIFYINFLRIIQNKFDGWLNLLQCQLVSPPSFDKEGTGYKLGVAQPETLPFCMSSCLQKANLYCGMALKLVLQRNKNWFSGQHISLIIFKPFVSNVIMIYIYVDAALLNTIMKYVSVK